jgi:hypothetical protein
LLGPRSFLAGFVKFVRLAQSASDRRNYPMPAERAFGRSESGATMHKRKSFADPAVRTKIQIDRRTYDSQLSD